MIQINFQVREKAPRLFSQRGKAIARQHVVTGTLTFAGFDALDDVSAPVIKAAIVQVYPELRWKLDGYAVAPDVPAAPFLFVGGSRDGQWLDVPLKSEKVLVSDSALSFEFYSKARLLDFAVFAPHEMSASALVALLLDGYQGEINNNRNNDTTKDTEQQDGR